MEEKAQKAEELFREGYNCCQSVFVAFADMYGIDRETALRLSTSFGGGYAGNRDVCGAISGMAMVAGLATGTSQPRDKEGKQNNYNCVNQLILKFREEHGSTLCRHLMGLEQSVIPIKRKKCYEYVRYCAQLLEENVVS